MRTLASLRRIERRYDRLFAIGDIHACPDELERLLIYLRNCEGLSRKDIVVFIGDYIDRGYDSKGVIDLLLGMREEYPDTVFLKGNHEDMMLSYLGFGGDAGRVYLTNGGGPALMSFGVRPDLPQAELQERFPKPHLEFFRALDDFIAVGPYIFVHAGLNPHLALDEQYHRDIFWIRNEFIESNHAFGKTVVFGHTPYQNLMFDLPYKIAIDTGLVYGNMLTCVELVLGKVYQIGFGEEEVIVSKVPG